MGCVLGSVRRVDDDKARSLKPGGEGIKNAEMLVAFVRDVKTDCPMTEAAVTGTVQRIECMGPDALAALAD